NLCGGKPVCNFVSNPIIIPPILQCGAANTCATCTEVLNYYNFFVDSLYHFSPTRTETDTASQRRNRLFTSYMNSHLGFTKQAWEYLDFKDRCAGSTGQKCVSCDSLQNLINAYFNQSGVYGGSQS